MRLLPGLIAIASCAEIPPIDAPYAAAACADWAVPVEGGTILTCSAERIVVRFPDALPEPTAERWRTALLADGWEIATDAGATGSPAMILQRADARRVLGVVASGSASVATVAVAP